MKVTTTRFGELDIPEDKVLSFPYGIPGFPALTRWCVLNQERSRVVAWFQAVDDPAVALLIADPEALFANYDVRVDARELAPIGVDASRASEAPPPVIMRVVLAADARRRRLTANLRAPLLINVETRRGMQLPLLRCDYSLRQPVSVDPGAGRAVIDPGEVPDAAPRP